VQLTKKYDNMIKKIILPILILAFQSSFAQSLNFELFEKLTKIASFSIDEYIVEGYGYEKISGEDDENVRKYGFVQNKNWDKAILVTVRYPKKKGYNAVEIGLGEGYELSEIKKLVTANEVYKYEGVNKEVGLNIYTKKNLTLLIPQKNKAESTIKLILIRE